MPLAVYLHLPFCVSRCRYCAFYSGEPLARLPDLVHELGAEIRLRAEEAHGPVHSVYFGGGTPSLLAPEQLAELLAAIRDAWGWERTPEVTLEANPGDRSAFERYRSTGVTRVSVGVQSFDAAQLSALGRRHTPDQARAAVAAAVGSGVTSVNADLLLGLPDSPPATLAGWVEELAALGVHHLSLYSLELHPGTALFEAAAAGHFQPADEALEAQQFEAVVRAAKHCGLHAYEVSNFARPGHQSRHNRAYWQGAAYLGLGPGAHSFLPTVGPWGTRRWNAPDLDGYLTALNRGHRPPGAGETLTREQALLERLFLALRCRAPLAPRALAAAFGLDPARTCAEFAALTRKGFFRPLAGDRLRPSWATLRRADGLALGLHQRLLAGSSAP